MILILVLSIFSFGAAELTNEADHRIVGGNAIPISLAPYQVSLRWIDDDTILFGSGFFCGGSLISTTMVLTAAHCLYDEDGNMLTASEIQVVGGNANLAGADVNTFISSVTSLKVHELYNHTKSYEHDIAVLKLTLKISETENSRTKVISLPTQTYPVGESCLISGWGTTSYGNTTVLHLRGARVIVNSVAECNLPQYLNESVQNGMFCAGSFEGGIDTCQGDSGGPLNCHNILYGITSHGVECGLSDYPGVYTDVYYYREWILKNSAVPNYFNFIIGLSTVLISLALVIICVCVIILIKKS